MCLGVGKSHNDAASVRTQHPIPAACGLYYFEVRIISKGRDGYMGIGLTAQNFKSNRLPGWDKQSYGYHGDDGNSFSSSGNGKSYGPTFTTDDIIGCGVNLVTNSCFYTKNGHNLGVAFQELPVSRVHLDDIGNNKNHLFIFSCYFSVSITVNVVSNRWPSNAWRSCHRKFRSRSICLRHRRYAQRIERIDKSFHPKISVGR